MSNPFRLVCVATFLAAALLAQQAPEPQQLVLTVLPHGSRPVPSLTPAQIGIRQGGKDDVISAVTAASGDAAALELYILFDRDAGARLLPSVGQLREFVAALPPQAKVGFGYLQAAGFQVTQPFTTDHAAAAAAIAVPEGGLSPSPFESIGALIAQWPRQPGVRREIIVFSDGEVPSAQDQANNPIVRRMLLAYQQAGVVVYAVVVPSSQQNITAGNGGTSLINSDMPQLGGRSSSPNGRGGARQGGPSDSAGVGVNALEQGYLKTVADETGGEVYWGQPLNPEVINGYLQDIQVRINHQYLVTFVPTAVKNPGPSDLKVAVNAPDVKVSVQKSIIVQ